MTMLLRHALAHPQVFGDFQWRAADATDYSGAVAAGQRVVDFTCAVRAIE
jgi:hypothetical protein